MNDCLVGSNVLAILDLQESYSFLRWQHVLPLVVTEYGGSVRAPKDATLDSKDELVYNAPDRQYMATSRSIPRYDDGDYRDDTSELTYSPMNDFVIMRGVLGKMMSFMDRPDRILRAIPFITAKVLLLICTESTCCLSPDTIAR